MTLTRTHAALLLATVAIAGTSPITIHAQTQNAAPASAPAPPASQIPQPPTRPQPARAVIFLDPAHGGPETGASLGNNVAEKDVTLAFAQLLRPALAASGFSVVTTRDADPSAAISTDDRAAVANRAHALACIVIHATASGNGLHLYTSSLPPEPPSNVPGPEATLATPFTPIPWETAQAGFVDRSRSLSGLLKATLAKSGLPVLTGAAPLRPLDNLMCPAVAVEIAPNSAAISASDANYQQQIVVALATALQLWRDQNTQPSGAAQ